MIFTHRVEQDLLDKLNADHFIFFNPYILNYNAIDINMVIKLDHETHPYTIEDDWYTQENNFLLTLSSPALDEVYYQILAIMHKKVGFYYGLFGVGNPEITLLVKELDSISLRVGLAFIPLQSPNKKYLKTEKPVKNKKLRKLVI